MPTTNPCLSRRAVLASVAAFTAGIASGCTPVRFGLRLYPEAFNDQDTCERVLRAFVLTAVPGALGSSQSFLTRCFGDDLFPFRPYRENFAADLCRRAGKRFGEPRFDRLDRHERGDHAGRPRLGLRFVHRVRGTRVDRFEGGDDAT